MPKMMMKYRPYLHHNYIHDIGTEGFYIGSSKWEEGLHPELDGGNTGFGFSVNKVTTGAWYNNFTQNTRSHAMFFNGGPIGDYRIFNNVVINAGRDGIRWQTGPNGALFENTIIKSADYGIRTGVYTNGEIFDNLVVEYGQEGVNGGQVTIFNNLELTKLQAAGFVDPQNNDFHIWESSPAVDAGTVSRNAPFDYDDNPRPAGSKPDIGAYEYVGASATAVHLNPPF